jgi:hypothetical protein
MGNYLVASVVVYNLFPHEYDDLSVDQLESAINNTMTSMRKVGFEANDGNMVFSFPQDPSVKSLSTPVLVDITLFSTSHFKPGIVRYNGIPEGIRTGLIPLFSGKHRGNVIVIVRQAGNISCSPKE